MAQSQVVFRARNENVIAFSAFLQHCRNLETTPNAVLNSILPTLNLSLEKVQDNILELNATIQIKNK